MKVTFWGTRGSLPRPLTAAELRDKAERLLAAARESGQLETIPADCPLPGILTFGGNTPCVEVEHDGARIICDCGTGLRDLGLAIGNTVRPGDEFFIFQTHTHWDHIMGFPFFGPAYVRGVRIHVYGVHPGLRERFETQMDRIHFPITLDEMSADIVFHQLQPAEETVVGPFTVTSKGLHHPGGSYAYRITAGGRTFVFATDGEYKDPMEEVFPPFVEFFRGADTLVFDAMYASIEKTIEKENFGHSTAVIGIELARRAGVKRLVLFHHDHEAGDDQIAHAYNEAIAYLYCTGNTALELAISWDGLVLDI